MDAMKKYEITFCAGEGRSCECANWMLAEIDGKELYAEYSLDDIDCESGDEPDVAFLGYWELRADIIAQAADLGVSADQLSFPCDETADCGDVLEPSCTVSVYYQETDEYGAWTDVEQLDVNGGRLLSAARVIDFARMSWESWLLDECFKAESVPTEYLLGCTRRTRSKRFQLRVERGSWIFFTDAVTVGELCAADEEI